MEGRVFKVSQYAYAVLLYYVAQSFLLAGSIFGLDQYVRFISRQYHERKQ